MTESRRDIISDQRLFRGRDPQRIDGTESRVQQRFVEADAALAGVFRGYTVAMWDKWGGFLRNLYGGPFPMPHAAPNIAICKVAPWSTEQETKIFSSENKTKTLRHGAPYEEPIRDDVDEHIRRIGKPLAIVGWTQRAIHREFLEKYGGIFLGASRDVRVQLENKYTFNGLLREAGISEARQLRHGLYNSSDAVPSFSELQRKYGSRFVIQTDASQGGKGTAIITNVGEFRSALPMLDGKLRISEYRDQQYSTTYLLTVPRDNGDCDVYVDSPSYKSTKIPELNVDSVTGAGGDWTLPYPETFPAEEYVENLVQLGKHLYQQYGLKGHWNIEGFLSSEGFDFNELNYRPGGGTEVSSTNQILRGVPPFMLAHLVLWAGGRVDFMPDADTFNKKTIAEIRQRSSINPFYLKVFGQSQQRLQEDIPGSGIYRTNPDGRLEWVRPGIVTTDANFDDGEVLLAHLPKNSTICDEKAQVCTIEGITSSSHIFSGQHALSQDGLQVANAVNALFKEVR
jgi:hypothetical protein